MSKELNEIASKIRLTTFRAIAHAGGGHFGGSLSIPEILAVLYFKVMHIDPENPEDENRDLFILSKGHGGPALYSTLALRGYYPVSELDKLDKPLTQFPKHIDRLKLRGIEASTGPLGQGLSIACGMAMSLKQRHRSNSVYIVMGDGECDSGQLWEAAMTAAKYRLDNLLAIVDKNNYQIDGACSEVMPTEPLWEKFASFGWEPILADGHDTESLLRAIAVAKRTKDKPSVIIASTIKGRGVSFMENRYEWHSGNVTKDQRELALAELEAA